MVFELSQLVLLGISSLYDIRKKKVTHGMLAAALLLSGTAIVYGFGAGRPQGSLTLLSLIPGALLLFLAFLSRESVGYGDGLMALCIAPVFGLWKLAAGLCLAFFLTGLYGGMLLITHRAGRKSCIPFLPSLTIAMGVIVCVANMWQ